MFYGDGLESLSSFQPFDISWWEGGGRRLHAKEEEKNAEVRVKKREEETRWVEGGIIPQLMGSKTLTPALPALPRIRVRSCH